MNSHFSFPSCLTCRTNHPEYATVVAFMNLLINCCSFEHFIDFNFTSTFYQSSSIFNPMQARNIRLRNLYCSPRFIFSAQMFLTVVVITLSQKIITQKVVSGAAD